MEKTDFSIITQSPYIRHTIKQKFLHVLRLLLWQNIYWPNAVYKSLVRGLEKINDPNIRYNINPTTNNIHNTVVVLMQKDPLRYALKLKKHKKIKKIIAGPAISVPLFASDIFFHPEIDVILVPSLWVKNYFISLNPYKPERIVIRSAGVQDTGVRKQSDGDILLYKKKCPDVLYDKVCSMLNAKNIGYKTLEYGSFSFDQYQQYLETASAMIYLQESESQWLALQEARVKGVPTLVRDREYRSYKWKNRRSKRISCPLMSTKCWLTFNENNIEKQLNAFITNITTFTPREYCKQALIDVVTSKKLLSIIKDI